MKHINIILIVAMLAACGTREDNKYIEENGDGDPKMWPELDIDICNIYVASTQLGDSFKRKETFQTIRDTVDCNVIGIFHAGGIATDYDAWWVEMEKIFERHSAALWPAKGVEDDWFAATDLLKSKLPYLDSRLSATKNYYMVETSASWVTVVLDTTVDPTEWSVQRTFLREIVEHGYSRIDVVMDMSAHTSTDGPIADWAIVQDLLPTNATVFSANGAGYSRDKVEDVSYVTTGSAGPDRTGCIHSVTTETCYPDASFTVCTESECVGYNRFGRAIDTF